MKQPLVAPLAALAAGIWAARFATITLSETLFSVSLLAALALAAVRLRVSGAGFAACLSGFFLAGALLACLPRPGAPLADPALITKVLDREQADLRDPIRLRGWVREPPDDLGDSDRFILEVESIFRDTPVRGGVRVTVHRLADARPLRLDYGQRVEFLARLRLLRNFQNPGSFDYVGYQNRREVYASATVRAGVPILAPDDLVVDGPVADGHVVARRGGSRWQAVVWRARLWARARFAWIETCCPGRDDRDLAVGHRDGATKQAYSTPAAGILRAMLLGERDSLDGQTTTDFQRTGAYHVLVISGLHIGLLAFVLVRFLRLLWVPRGLAAALIVVLLAFYALLVGAGTPVLRAAWMLAAYLVTTLVYRQRRALNVIAATAFLFLVADPKLLFDAGFQLSFLAVALIAGVAVPVLDTTIEPLRMALRDIWNTDRDLHCAAVVAGHRVAIRAWLEPLAILTGLRRTWISFPVTGGIRVLVWAAGLAVVSLIIQAGLALPLVYHFQRFSGSGVSANLAIVPLLFLAVPVGLAALLTGWAPLAQIALWAAGAIGAVVEWHASHLPLEIRVPPPPVWLAVCFGLSLVLVAFSVASFGARRKQWLAAAVSVALLFLLVWHPFPPDLPAGRMELSILDVGQGDSLFAAFPGGQTMIVDGGGQPDFRDPDDPPTRLQPIDIGELVVSRYLWSRSVKRLDVVAVTHADGDHLGGIPALLRNFEVGELWLGETTFAAEYGGIVNLARARGTTIRRIHEGQSAPLGEAQVEILGPSLPPAERRNDQSLVLRLRYGQQNFLLTGDIEQGRENALAASGWLRPSSFLKVAHHGSRSSSQPEFLRRVRPLFAVISAGSDNFYGHPHPAVIQRLAEMNATVLRTNEEGLISVATDGRRLFVDTFRRRSLRGSPAAELAVASGR